MNKVIPAVEQNILNAIENAAEQTASVDQISGFLNHVLPRRTLQRRLAGLVQAGRITCSGKGPATRYSLPWISTVFDESLIVKEAVSNNYALRMSTEAAEIRASITQPLERRRPAGYNRNFLDSYIPNETWYLSGEIREHLAGQGRSLDESRPAGTHARKILNRLLIDLSWNSSRLEGNTYSLLETDRLIELGESAEGRGAIEAQMILNHKAAIEMMVEQADEIGFNRYTILPCNALLSDNLLESPMLEGRLRNIQVGISGTTFHPLGVPQQVEECFDEILTRAAAISNPFEQSFFVMVHLPYLQPFQDVNKRVSRLAANIPFICQNLSPLSFVDVPERDYIDGILGVYELNRVELLRDVFVRAYERSCVQYAAIRHVVGPPDPIRTKYREAIFDIASTVIRGSMDKKSAGSYIQKAAREKASEDERTRFIELVETSLMTLHDGNFAKFRVRLQNMKPGKKTGIEVRRLGIWSGLHFFCLNRYSPCKCISG